MSQAEPGLIGKPESEAIRFPEGLNCSLSFLPQARASVASEKNFSKMGKEKPQTFRSAVFVITGGRIISFSRHLALPAGREDQGVLRFSRGRCGKRQARMGRNPIRAGLLPLRGRSGSLLGRQP